MAREQGGKEASAPSAGSGVARRAYNLLGSLALRDPDGSDSLTTVLVAFGASKAEPSHRRRRRRLRQWREVRIVVREQEEHEMEAPRNAGQRKNDTLARLVSDVDAWIATADAAGNAYLLPLSFLWDGAGVIVSTPRTSVTGRNLSRGGRVRVGIGQLRDVTMLDGTAEPVQDERTKDAFADKHGWDPRTEAGDYAYFRIVSDRVQAWREVNELPGRTLMRDGDWLA